MKSASPDILIETYISERFEECKQMQRKQLRLVIFAARGAYKQPKHSKYLMHRQKFRAIKGFYDEAFMIEEIIADRYDYYQSYIRESLSRVWFKSRTITIDIYLINSSAMCDVSLPKSPHVPSDICRCDKKHDPRNINPIRQKKKIYSHPVMHFEYSKPGFHTSDPYPKI